MTRSATTLCVVFALASTLAACTSRHSDDAGPTQAPPAAAQAATPSGASPYPVEPASAAPGTVQTAAALRQPASPAPPAGALPTETAAKPAILSVDVSPATAHDGDTISWDVRTTPDVTAVEAHVRVATIPLQRDAPGHFSTSFTIPKSVPGFFHGNYSVDIVARAGDGQTLTRSVSLNFR